MTQKDTRTHAQRAEDKTRYNTRRTRAYVLVNLQARAAGMELDDYLDMMEAVKPEAAKTTTSS